MVQGLDHIAIIVSSEDSLEFYKKFGFVETKRFVRSYDTVVFMECTGNTVSSSIVLEILWIKIILPEFQIRKLPD